MNSRAGTERGDPGAVSPLAWFAAGIAIYMAGNVIHWAARFRLHLGLDVVTRLEYVLLGIFAATFLATTCILAVRVRRRGLVVAAVVAAGSAALEEGLRIPLGVLWMRGMYQIDYDRGAFVVWAEIETLVFSFLLALVALLIGICAVAARNFARGGNRYGAG